MIKSHIPGYRFSAHLPVLIKQLPGVVFIVATVYVVKMIFTNNILVFGFSALIGLAGYGLLLLCMRIEEVEYLKSKVFSRLGLAK